MSTIFHNKKANDSMSDLSSGESFSLSSFSSRLASSYNLLQAAKDESNKA
jgi:hypothetical protein